SSKPKHLNDTAVARARKRPTMQEFRKISLNGGLAELRLWPRAEHTNIRPAVLTTNSKQSSPKNGRHHSLATASKRFSSRIARVIRKFHQFRKPTRHTNLAN